MNATIYLAIPLMLILLVIQVTVSPHIELLGVAPQLLFLVSIVLGLFYGLQQGLILAFIAGILFDLYSAGPMGASSLALMAAVSAAVFAQRRLPENRILVPAALGALASLVFWFVYILLLRILVPFMIDSLDFLSIAGLAGSSRAQGLIGQVAQNYGLGGSMGNLVLRSTIVHSLLMVPIYLALSALGKLTGPKRVEL
ncbi:MAG: rod shape-determining protein MreD [Candidatus Promineifilaceae bacterium]